MKTKMKTFLASSLVLGGVALGAASVNGSVNAEPLFFARTEGEVRERQVRRELGTFAALTKDLNPSVVNISVVKRASGVSGNVQIPEEFRRMIPEEMLPQMRGRSAPEVSGQGSGVIVSAATAASSGRVDMPSHARTSTVPQRGAGRMSHRTSVASSITPVRTMSSR